jgi:azurin
VGPQLGTIFRTMFKRLLLAAAIGLAPLAAFAQDEVKLEVTSNDMMQYDKKALEVTTGQKVTITLKHVGKLPKVAMGHNIVILKPGTVAPTFAMKAMTAAATSYIPQDEDSKKTIVAHSETIGGGESTTFSFVAPEPGAYPYLCTFPGHFALMQGVLTVKPK